MSRSLARTALAATAVVAVATLAVGQQAQKQPELTPAQKAEMEVYMKAGTPGGPHRALASFVGNYDHDHPGAFRWRKRHVVFIVAILGHERSCELPCQAVMLDVARAPKVFVLEHEEHIPAEALPHEADRTAGNIRVRIDPRRVSTPRVRRELGSQCAQSVNSCGERGPTRHHSSVAIQFGRLFADRLRLAGGGFGLTDQVSDELITFMDQLAARPPSMR